MGLIKPPRRESQCGTAGVSRVTTFQHEISRSDYFTQWRLDSLKGGGGRRMPLIGVVPKGNQADGIKKDSAHGFSSSTRAAVSVYPEL
jgi:hypothetical protein